MIGENNGIFLAGGDALVYLAEPMHKKYSTINLFGAIHLVRTYLKTDFSTAFPCTHLYTLHMTPQPPPFPQLRTYLMDGLFLNEKKKTTFEYRIH